MDHLRVALPAGRPAGKYDLNVGWYDSATLQRLPATGEPLAPAGDGVRLVVLTVTEA